MQNPEKINSRKPLLTSEEIARRQDILDNVLRDHLLEDLAPSEFAKGLLQSYVTGEKTFEEIFNILNRKHKGPMDVTVKVA